MIGKPEFISKMAKISGLTKKDSEKAFEAFLNVIEEGLIEGEDIALVGIGIFELKERSERVGRNPQTQEQIVIPASSYPNFKISQTLKEKVKKAKNKSKGK